MAAFIPGESPPEVNTATFFISEAIKNFRNAKLTNLLEKMNAHPAILWPMGFRYRYRKAFGFFCEKYNKDSRKPAKIKGEPSFWGKIGSGYPGP
jgi:hypothetical protein